MASSYVSWGQRKALGKRYGVDPAYLLEQERLENEYALLPQREARELQKRAQDIQSDQFSQTMRFNEEQAALNRAEMENAQRQQMLSGIAGTAGNVLATGATIRALTMKPGEKFFGGLLDRSVPQKQVNKTVTPATTDSAATGIGITQAAPAFSGAGIGGAETTTNALGAPVAGFTTPAAYDVPSAMMTTTNANIANAEALSVTGAGAAGAGPGAAGGLMTYAGPVGAGLAIGGLTKGLKVGEKVSDVAPVGGTREWNAGVGVAGGAAAGAAIAGPVGAVVGGIAGALGASCIIVTACTSRVSPEVELARKYRDIFLDADQLRGYYALAERIVPYLERSENARYAVKKWLVDRLVDYGGYRLGLKEEKPCVSSCIVSHAFLMAIKMIGASIPRYVRENGEVY